MSLDFDGLTVQADEILPILRDAAHGSVPVQDVDAAQNPGAWALAFAHAVAQSVERNALAAAVQALLASASLPEAQLGLELQRQTKTLGADALWPLVFAHAVAGRPEGAALAAAGIVPLAATGHATFDARACDLLEAPELAPRLRDTLLALAGGPARDWLVAHATSVLGGTSDSDTLGRIGAVATTLGSDALEALATALSARFAEAGEPLPTTTVTTLGAMVAARRSAGK